MLLCSWGAIWDAVIDSREFLHRGGQWLNSTTKNSLCCREIPSPFKSTVLQVVMESSDWDRRVCVIVEDEYLLRGINSPSFWAPCLLPEIERGPKDSENLFFFFFSQSEWTLLPELDTCFTYHALKKHDSMSNEREYFVCGKGCVIKDSSQVIIVTIFWRQLKVVSRIVLISKCCNHV